MIRRKERLIWAVMFISLFLLARSAGGDVISYTPPEYTIFAGGDLDVGIGDTGGSHIGQMVGTGGDVTFAPDVMVSDVGGYSSSDFGDDDVTIGDSFCITGRVNAGDDLAAKTDIVVGNYPQAASLYAAGVVVILTNADVGVSGSAQDLHGNGAGIGTGSEGWDNVRYTAKLTNNTLHLDCTPDARIAPGTYRNLNLIARASY